MLKTVLFTVSLILAQMSWAASGSFPKGPNPELTPGDTCKGSSVYRYPERIPYCNRDVNTWLKKEVILDYDHDLGYRVGSMPRVQFKIDHYIPLCMGGSNEKENLWPQHESVYTITDPLEELLCQKMAAGRLKQADAIDMIKQAKNNLDQVDDIIRRARRL